MCIRDREALSKDLLEVGTTRWETLFNPQRLDLASVSAEVILELENSGWDETSRSAPTSRATCPRFLLISAACVRCC